MDETTWATPSPEFGAAWPHGCCNAITNDSVCGFPRNDDGTCPNGHPAQPGTNR